RTVRTRLPTATGSHVGPEKHRRGVPTERSTGLRQAPEHRRGVPRRSRVPLDALSGSGACATRIHPPTDGRSQRDRTNVARVPTLCRGNALTLILPCPIRNLRLMTYDL